MNSDLGAYLQEYGFFIMSKHSPYILCIRQISNKKMLVFECEFKKELGKHLFSFYKTNFDFKLQKNIVEKIYSETTSIKVAMNKVKELIAFLKVKGVLE